MVRSARWGSASAWVASALWITAQAPGTARAADPEPAPAPSLASTSASPWTSGAAASLPGWTLDEVVRLGLRKGRIPRRLRSELKAARHVFGRTGSRFQPQLSAILDERGEKTLRVTQRLADLTRATVEANDPAEDGSPETYSFELFLPLFRTQALELKTAEYNWQATRLRNHQSLEDYKLDLVRRFYAVLRAHSRVAIARRNVERWDQNLELARFRADIGVRSKLDFWNTKVNQADAVTGLISTELAERAAMDELANQLGIEFEDMRRARETLDFDPFAAQVDPSWRRADLEARRFELRLRNAEVVAARRNSRPDINLTLGSSKTEGATRDDSARFVYNFPLGRNTEVYQLRFAHEARTQAEIRVESQRYDIEQEQREVVRDLAALAKNVEVAEERLELAKLSYEASRLQFESGRITQIELQRSQDNLARAEQTYEGFLIDYKIAGYRWRRAFGGRLF